MFDGEEEIVSSAAYRIQTRQDALGAAYPFTLDRRGDVLTCGLNEESFGQTAYVLSLVLSNLRAVSPVLGRSDLHPDDLEVPRLREFRTQPVTDFIPYMVVPFATADNQFMDDVRVMGNVLHRLRVPRRVAEAARLVKAGVTIEGYDRLAEAARWVSDYRSRAGAAA